MRGLVLTVLGRAPVPGPRPRLRPLCPSLLRCQSAECILLLPQPHARPETPGLPVPHSRQLIH